MFPWLPFLTFPESNFRLCQRRRKLRRNVRPEDTVIIKTNCPGFEFRIEYILPPKNINPTTEKVSIKEIQKTTTKSTKISKEISKNKNEESVEFKAIENVDVPDDFISADPEKPVGKFIPKFECSISLDDGESLENSIVEDEEKQDNNEILKEQNLNGALIQEQILNKQKDAKEVVETLQKFDPEKQINLKNSESKVGKFLPKFECSISLDDSEDLDAELNEKSNDSEVETVRMVNKPSDLLNNEIKQENFNSNSLESTKLNSPKVLEENESGMGSLPPSQNENNDLNVVKEIENTIPEDPIITRCSTSASTSSPTRSPRPAQIPKKYVSTPPTIRATNSRRRAFETSSAMLELFGQDTSTKDPQPNRKCVDLKKAEYRNKIMASERPSNIEVEKDRNLVEVNDIISNEETPKESAVELPDTLKTTKPPETMSIIGGPERILNGGLETEDYYANSPLKNDSIPSSHSISPPSNGSSTKARIYRNSSSGLAAALFGISNEPNRSKCVDENAPSTSSNSDREEIKVIKRKIEQKEPVARKFREQEIHPIDPTSPRKQTTAIDGNNKKSMEFVGSKKGKEAVLPAAANAILNSKSSKSTQIINKSTFAYSFKSDCQATNKQISNQKPINKGNSIVRGTGKNNSINQSRILPTQFGGGGGFSGGGGMFNLNGESGLNGGNDTKSESKNGLNGGSGGNDTEQIWFKNAQIINDDEIFAADILIENGIILKIFPSENPQEVESILKENVEIIDASGHWILPAGIDVHTEFPITNTDEIKNGTKAAIEGGTTTIVNAVRKSGNALDSSLVNIVERSRDLLEANSECNFALSVIFNEWDNERSCSEMTHLVQEKGINNFILEKCTNDVDLLNALVHAKDLGVHLRLLPENSPIVAALEKQIAQNSSSLSNYEQYLQARPVELETELIHRVCVLSKLSNAPFSVLSVSSAEASSALYEGRKDGALVHAEIPISATTNSGNDVCTQIPIRNSVKNSEAVLSILADVLWERGVVETGHLDPMRFVAVTSSNPAKMFNMYPKKGRIAVGADADLVLWDFDSERQIPASASPFDELVVHATPIITICDGRIIWRNEKTAIGYESSQKSVKRNKKSDRFIQLDPNSPYVFSTVQLRQKV